MTTEVGDLFTPLELNAEGCAYWRRELDGVTHPVRVSALTDADVRSAFEELIEIASKLHALGEQFDEIVGMLAGHNVAAPKLELDFNGSYLERLVELHLDEVARAPQRAEWKRRNPAPERFMQYSRPKGLRTLLAWDRFTAGLAARV